MRPSIALLAVLAAVNCAPGAALAQSGRKPAERSVPAPAVTGEEAYTDVDPAVLDRCRQQAADQKLKDGTERKAFMGTCVTPED